jgi:hypothetical protein
LAATDILQLFQAVEGPQWRELQGDVHSVSLLVRSSVAGLSFGLALADSPATKSLTKLCTIPNANTWTLIPLPNIPVWPAANFISQPGVVGYQFLITLAAGTTYTPPANDTWQSGAFFGAVGQANFAASPVNSTFDLAFAQHEPGPVSSTAMDCPFTQNYEDCLRFFQKTYDYDVAIGTANGVGDVGVTQYNTTQAFGSIRFHKPMAKIPTLTAYNTITGAAGVYQQRSTLNYAVSAYNNVGKSGFFGLTFAATPALSIGDLVRFHYTADTGW